MSIDGAPDLESTARSTAPRDPRQCVEPTLRDLRVLRQIGTLEWLAQYQIHALEFDGKSETVVSRSVRRLWKAGHIRIERFGGQGINLSRLTEAGAAFVVDKRVAKPEELFIPRRRYDPRQLAHHLSLVDARVAISKVSPGSRISTCWQLRREFANTTAPIPDLLVANPSTNGLLAIEIDRGTESLRGRQGLVEKLERLTAFEPIWAGATSRQILVLTIGASRIASLQSRLAESRVPASVLELPAATGRPAIESLVRLFARR